MHALYCRAFLGSYIDASLADELPPILTCRGGELYPRTPKEDLPAVARLVAGAESRGVPVFDHFVKLNLADEREALAAAKAAFEALMPGLTFLIIHPARDTPELRAMSDRWAHRVNEYRTFLDPSLRRHVADRGIQVIGCPRYATSCEGPSPMAADRTELAYEASRRLYSLPRTIRFYAGRDFLLDSERAILDAHADDLHGKSILDLGMGTGRTTEYLLRLSRDYVGVDYSPAMSEYCRSRFPGVDFRCGDAADLSPFADGSFDVVVFSFNGIDHAPPALD